jgi:hypothetical protein
MAKIDKTYPGSGVRVEHNVSSAVAHFDRPFSVEEERAMRYQMAGAAVVLICVLALICWALTL